MKICLVILLLILSTQTQHQSQQDNSNQDNQDSHDQNNQDNHNQDNQDNHNQDQTNHDEGNHSQDNSNGSRTDQYNELKSSWDSSNKDNSQNSTNFNKNATINLKQIVITLNKAKTTSGKEESLRSIMKQINTINQNTNSRCVCQNGQCLNQICVCQADYVGTLCELNRTSTLSNIVDTYSAMSSLFTTEMTQAMYSHVSSITVDLSGINSLSDEKIVSQQVSLLTNLNSNSHLSDLFSANNMIKIYQNTQNQMSELQDTINDRRILTIMQLGGNDTSKTTISDYFSQTLNDAEFKQYQFDTLFQKILITNHKIMLNSSRFYQQILHRNLAVVMTVLNLTTNQSIQSVQIQDMLFNVSIPAVISQLTDKNNTKPAVFLLSRQLESWKSHGSFAIQDQLYVQVNISQPITYSPMFTETTLNTFNSSPLSITFPKSQGKCVYFDQESLQWLDETMQYSGMSTQIECSTYHLTNFAIGINIFNPEDETRENEQLGYFNLIVVLAIYILASLAVAFFRRHRSTQGKFNSSNQFEMKLSQIVVVEDRNLKDNKNNQDYINDKPDFITLVPNKEINEDEKNQQALPIEPENQDEINPDNVISYNPYQYTTNIKKSDIQEVGSSHTNHEDKFSRSSSLSTPTKQESKKQWRLCDFVCCICPYPQSWTPSNHRLSIIFLWFTCYQFVFCILQLLKPLEDQMIGVLFITLVVSNILNYVYAGIAFGLSKAVPAHSYLIVQLLINSIILLQLLAVFLLYSHDDSNHLKRGHITNLLFQLIINMGIFDFLMELISKYRGIKLITQMRSFKLIKYVDL